MDGLSRGNLCHCITVRRAIANWAPLKTLSKRKQIWYNRGNKKEEEKEMQFGFFDIENKENRLSKL
ncbi:MAG: hypothetical protein IKN72_09110, partial [Clostridia bacterium]|nr:hypothetical protein [Clostridia bacterium]